MFVTYMLLIPNLFTMKKTPLFLVSIILLVSCQQTIQNDTTSEGYQEEVKKSITQFNKLYLEAWENEDLDSIMFFLDEGFINMFSFGMSMTKEQCRDGFPDVFDTYAIEDVETEIVDVIADQNYAFGTNLLKQKWITNDKQDTIHFHMRGMTVYKKQDDGSWKIFWSIGQNAPQW